MNNKILKEKGQKCGAAAKTFRLFASFIFLASVMFFFGCGAQEDVNFARRTFEALLQGRYSARYALDWPSLVMLEHSVGAEYQALPKDEETKAKYERAFIDGVKQAFKENRGSIKSFFNWHMYNGNDPQIKIVAANCYDKNKMFLFVVKHEKGKKKLMEIKALQIADQDKFYQYEKEQGREMPVFNKK